MQQRVTIIGEMVDGTCLVEHVIDFDAFIAVALPLWRDSECVRLTWHETPGTARCGRPARTCSESEQVSVLAEVA